MFIDFNLPASNVKLVELFSVLLSVEYTSDNFLTKKDLQLEMIFRKV